MGQGKTDLSCYPTALLDKFKEEGGIVYTVGFSFDGDSTAFMALASDESCQFLANDADQLNVAMTQIAAKIKGLIIDPMGEYVDLVSDVKVDGYTDSDVKVVDNTIYWNNADGLSDPVTLTYQVKIKQSVLDRVETADEGLDVYLNGTATLNYSYNGKEVIDEFPKPYITLNPAPKYFTLHYESNGGTKFDDDHYKKDETVTLTNQPTKTGFTFTGWYEDESLTELVTRVTMNSDKTVYAGWKADETPDLEKSDHSAYIIGYPDETVRPEQDITRAEVATIFFRLLTDDARKENWSSTNDYKDVPDDAWYNNAVSTLSNMGILKGYPDGSFKPNAKITRAEFAVIATRFSKSTVDGTASFTDVSKDFWASKEIAKAEKLGWIKGDGNGKFRPNDNIKRYEVMILVNRVLERAVDKEGICEDVIKWSDNPEGKWYYEDVQEATNSHEFARTDRPVKGQSFCYEEWFKLKENRDWSELESTWKAMYE